MQKKILNITELLIIGWIIIGVFGFYEDTNSVSRFSSRSNSLRMGIDLLIIGVLLFRSVQILENFNKGYSELRNFKIFEKVGYGLCLISLLPDLTTWYQWNYFANLYLHILIIFSLPIIMWTIEVIERKSTQKCKIRIYGWTFLMFLIPIIGYTLYLSQIK